MINERNWAGLQSEFLSNGPYNHIVIDNFWKPEIAEKLSKEFPEYNSPVWNAHYHNPIEDKKGCNLWDKFPSATYRAFSYLNSPEFVKIIETIVGRDSVYTDIGLHGGGWHCHHRGGKLNIHLDYSIHPKLKLERHYNIIIYMTPDWNSEWGGGLEVWDHYEDGTPKNLAKTIENKFNRAVIFDTTQYSWHGLPKELNCPDGINRQSFAVYYLTDPGNQADTRSKALFAPYGAQADDPAILELILKRASETTAETVWKL